MYFSALVYEQINPVVCSGHINKIAKGLPIFAKPEWPYVLVSSVKALSDML